MQDRCEPFATSHLAQENLPQIAPVPQAPVAKSKEAKIERIMDPEDEGVTIALDKICSLESRLRQAIQSTHSLNRSFGRDMGTVDREREALLLIRENLELLEDKLREYRTMAMDPKGYDDKAIALSQLDSLRKDLLRGARDRVDYVLFNKDIVKDIMAFADTGTGDESLPDLPPEPETFANGTGCSASQSPCSSDGDESCYQGDSGDFAEQRSYIPSSRGASPYASKQSLSVLMPDKEDMFPYPAPASTPGIRASSSQSTRDYHRHLDVGSDSIPNLHGSSVDQRFRPPRHPSSNPSPEANPTRPQARQSNRSSTRSLAFRDTHAGAEDNLRVSGYGKNAREGRQDGHMRQEDQSLHDSIQPRLKRQPQIPPSCISSSDTPRHEELSENLNAHNQAPPFGGKLSFSRRDNPATSGPVVPLPPTPVPADRPRVTSTSSYSSDDQASVCRPTNPSSQAYQAPSEIEPLRPNNSEQLIQPSRHSTISIRSKREAAQAQEVKAGLGVSLRGQTWRMLKKFSIVGDFARGAFSGAVGLAALYTVFQAVGKSGFALQLPAIRGRKKEKFRRAPSLEDLWKPFPSLPRLPSRSPSNEQLGKPRADGHLVPEWMHKTQFSATDQPPLGSLTPSNQPPAGEMFPVIPPPTSKHVKC